MPHSAVGTQRVAKQRPEWKWVGELRTTGRKRKKENAHHHHGVLCLAFAVYDCFYFSLPQLVVRTVGRVACGDGRIELSAYTFVLFTFELRTNCVYTQHTLTQRLAHTQQALNEE